EPSHSVTVEMRLIDGLRGPDVKQLGRAVGGAADHGNSPVMGLDHGRMKLYRGCSTGDHDRSGTSRGGSQPQGEECTRPLVVMDVQPYTTIGGQRERH